jgi:hypothetical protein
MPLPIELRRKIANIARAIACISCILSLIGWLTKIPVLFWLGFTGSCVGVAVFALFLVPWLLFTLFVLLAPFFLSAEAEKRGYPIIQKWWFWVFTAVSVISGFVLLLKFCRKYGNRRYGA